VKGKVSGESDWGLAAGLLVAGYLYVVTLFWGDWINLAVWLALGATIATVSWLASRDRGQISRGLWLHRRARVHRPKSHLHRIRVRAVHKLANQRPTLR
jgi:hypothetical protein